MAWSANTEQTRLKLKSAGYRFDSIERYSYAARKTFDFCGFGDLAAYKPPLVGTLIVNSCHGGGTNEHLTKYMGVPEIRAALIDWLTCGNRFEVWAWKLLTVRDESGDRIRCKDKKNSHVNKQGKRIFHFKKSKRYVVSVTRFLLIAHDVGYDLDYVTDTVSELDNPSLVHQINPYQNTLQFSPFALSPERQPQCLPTRDGPKRHGRKSSKSAPAPKSATTSRKTASASNSASMKAKTPKRS